MQLKILNDNGTIYLQQGPFGHSLGTLAEARATLRQAFLDAASSQDCNKEATIRGAARRLRDSGLDPRTATLAQIRTALEGSDIDA